MLCNMTQYVTPSEMKKNFIFKKKYIAKQYSKHAKIFKSKTREVFLALIYHVQKISKKSKAILKKNKFTNYHFANVTGKNNLPQSLAKIIQCQIKFCESTRFLGLCSSHIYVKVHTSHWISKRDSQHNWMSGSIS